MDYKSQLRNLLGQYGFEETRADFYTDSEGYLTVGIGSKVTSNTYTLLGRDEGDNKNITPEEINMLFDYNYADLVEPIASRESFNLLSDETKLAIGSIAFQQNLKNYKNFQAYYNLWEQSIGTEKEMLYLNAWKNELLMNDPYNNTLNKTFNENPVNVVNTTPARNKTQTPNRYAKHEEMLNKPNLIKMPKPKKEKPMVEQPRVEEPMRPADMPDLSDDATFGRRGY